jgi:D-hexose-6-phosphate mutarotase
VYLHGAHVTAFQPHGAEPVLWMSALAEFRRGKAIRGGVPIVWPWFGPHPSDATKPQHGFARVSKWKIVGTRALPDGGTEIRLGLGNDAATGAFWPHAFELELKLKVGTRLQLELTSRNTGAEAIEVGGALHTYFHVGEVSQVTIDGLGGREYIDQLDLRRVKRQDGPIMIAEETDRIYLETPDECVIDDPLLQRRIRFAKKGSLTTVVWNPWMEKARRMMDFPDEGYRTMVCIEAANAEGDVRRLDRGAEHTLAQTISVESC